jgi:pimeloyl-ACP methyl ester carboxylesterase
LAALATPPRLIDFPFLNVRDFRFPLFQKSFPHPQSCNFFPMRNSRPMPRASLSSVTINFMKMGSWSSGRTPLVFVHGLAASSAFWFHAAEAMGRDWPVLVYDLRGHGRSSVPAEGYSAVDQAVDLLGLLDHLEIQKAVLAGHSFGGSVVLHAALRAPQRFTHLALADTRLRTFQAALTPSAWPKWQEQRAALEKAGLSIAEDEPEAGVSVLTVIARLTLQADSEAALPHWMTEFFGQRQSRHTAGRWIDLVEKTSLLADIRREENLSADVLRDFPMPMLAVYGDHSPLLPSGQALREARPSTTFKVVEGAGHFFPAVRPRELTDPLTMFLG